MSICCHGLWDKIHGIKFKIKDQVENWKKHFGIPDFHHFFTQRYLELIIMTFVQTPFIFNLSTHQWTRIYLKNSWSDDPGRVGSLQNFRIVISFYDIPFSFLISFHGIPFSFFLMWFTLTSSLFVLSVLFVAWCFCLCCFCCLLWRCCCCRCCRFMLLFVLPLRR